ncbi:MAG TPA: phosphatase PAP2 family protein [Patescibacteria group bacterium]|nr:phosphatase PAP2 family protein [Patescibacteria group bacterium]
MRLAGAKYLALTAASAAILHAGAAFAAGDAAKSINDIRYPESGWAKNLLGAMKEGPQILPADFDDGIGPPPANDSETTKADIKSLLEMQKTERTPETIERIKLENEQHDQPWIFVHDGLLRDNDYRTKLLIATVLRDVSWFLLRDKYKYERARPTQLEPNLTTVIPIPQHGSYPSGHAGQSWATALVLGLVDPANKDKYEKLALDYAHRREIAGIHYPGDSEAARMLATNVVAALMKTDKIKTLLERAIEEHRDEAETH